MDNNIDDFFQGKIKLFQPSYKATSDAVLLGCVVRLKSGTVLDVGTGNGAIAVISAFNNKNVKVTGIDINPNEILHAKKNAGINGLEIDFINADINDNPLKSQSFDFVVTNPPFFKDGTVSKDETKKLAHHENKVSLIKWLEFCVRRTRYMGYIATIVDAGRVPEVLSVLKEKCGEIKLFPLYPRQGESPKRVIIKSRKESKTPFSLLQGLILHKKDGSYTEEANRSLRNAEFIDV